jgi:Reverse transcriptase (RNA-dependent DNA polymerase)
VGRSGPDGKPFSIPKQLVWEAYKQVKANKGAAGVDGQSIEDFEKDLRNNLYKIWNRMSSGTYFPPPVRAVEIPKPHGGGTRMLGIPTVADRVAQTVAALALEPRTESIFHDDSYGYRPGRSPLMAVAKCRERCWKKDWVIDLDVRKLNVFHPPISRVWRTCMALASCPAFHGQQRSLRRMRQVLSWALARSPGPRSLAWARLAAFCEAGLPRPLYGVITGSPAP